MIPVAAQSIAKHAVTVSNKQLWTLWPRSSHLACSWLLRYLLLCWSCNAPMRVSQYL